jgi:hypothetical protein
MTFAAYLLSTYLGNQARIGPLLLCNLLMIPALAYAVINALSHPAPRDAVSKFLVAATYVACLAAQIPRLALETHEGAAAKSFYLLHGVCFALLMISQDRILPTWWLVRILKAGFYVSVLIVIMQLMFIVFNVPTLEFLMQTELHDQWLVTGAFGNPNNLAVVIFLTILGLTYIRHQQGYSETSNSFESHLSYLLGLFVVILTISRTVLVLYLALLAYRYRRQLISPIGLIILLGLAGMFVYLINNSDSIQTQIVAIDRVATRIASITESGSASGDESVSFRSQAYLRFGTNFSYLPFGLGFNNYSIFFGGMKGYEYFLNESPHSYFGEILLSQGLSGALLILSLLACYVRVTASQRSVAPLIFLSLFAIASFVPGSMMLTPAAIVFSMLPMMVPATTNS